MKRPIRISPSILSADFGRLAEEVKAIATADYVHVDVMDGHFVPNLTIGPLVVEAVKRATQLPLDVHLMIEDADRWVADYARAGADLIGVHVEACPHLQRTLALIRELGARAGVALNPATLPETIEYVLDDLDLVLVMSVNPGFGGQKFIPAVYPKIRRVRAMLGSRPVEVSVDGGVKVEHARPLAEHGASILVAGSAIFGASDPGAVVEAMRQAAG